MCPTDTMKTLEITHIIKITIIQEYCEMRHSAMDHFYPQIIMNYLKNKNKSLFSWTGTLVNK